MRKSLKLGYVQPILVDCGDFVVIVGKGCTVLECQKLKSLIAKINGNGISV